MVGEGDVEEGMLGVGDRKSIIGLIFWVLRNPQSDSGDMGEGEASQIELLEPGKEERTCLSERNLTQWLYQLGLRWCLLS